MSCSNTIAHLMPEHEDVSTLGPENVRSFSQLWWELLPTIAPVEAALGSTPASAPASTPAPSISPYENKTNTRSRIVSPQPYNFPDEFADVRLFLDTTSLLVRGHVTRLQRALQFPCLSGHGSNNRIFADTSVGGVVCQFQYM